MLLWPGPTIRVLAVTAGAVLVVDGVLDLLAAHRSHGTGRASAVLSGATSVLLGALALAWPDVTVLVVAVLVGVRVPVAGLRSVGTALRGWARPRDDRATRRTRPDRDAPGRAGRGRRRVGARHDGRHARLRTVGAARRVAAGAMFLQDEVRTSSATSR